MSFVALLPSHVSPSALAIGFALSLVLWLVAAEEAELRRPAPPAEA